MNHYSFDLNKVVIFDVEVFPNRWLVGFYGRGKNGDLVFHQVEDHDSLKRALDGIKAAGKTLVGYNSDGYDGAIVSAILKGSDPYSVSQDIILLGKRRKFDLDIDHVDLAARLKRGGGFPGLKTVAANLGLPIEELSSAWFSEPVEDGERWDIIKAYNRRDLETTYQVLKRFTPELAALARLSNELGEDLRSTASPQVVERFFIRAYQDSTGSEPESIETPSSVRYRAPESVKRPRNKTAHEWFNRITTEPLMITERESGSISWKNPPKATFSLGKLRVSVGIGGLHSVDKPKLYRSTKARRLILADVSSYYPSLISRYGFTPSSTGEAGREAYRRILNRRLEIKQAASVEPDPERRAALKAEETGLKLLLNSLFGKLGDRYSKLFDPAAMVAVTLTGQALLINLIENLHKVGARVVSANTDGIVFSVPRHDRRHKAIMKRWQERTGLKLDVTPLKRFVALATNNAAYLTSDGKVKSIGKLKTDYRPLASPNGLAIAESVVKAALFDIPVEDTLNTITDPARFAFVSRKTKATKRAVLITGNSEQELGKVSRWYRAKFNDDELKPVIRHESQAGRFTTPAKAQAVRLMLDIPGRIPSDLDRGFYVSEARRLYQKLEGLPRSRRLVERYPLALTVFDRGLLPCPMWEKRSFKGRDAKRPSIVWPWYRAETIGAYTGPETGVLIVDIDEPRKWRAAVTEAEFSTDRLDDFATALVSSRGVDPNAIRFGLGRGKLIFRIEANEALAFVKATKFHKALGVDIFYGDGIPAVLGAGQDGSEYTLDGELGEAPAWLVEFLVKRVGAQTRKPKKVVKERTDRLFDYGTERETSGQFQDLIERLNKLDPKLAAVQWIEKDIDERTIIVGRCPFEHESGTSNQNDLGAGLDESGFGWLRCFHASCERSKEINADLKPKIVFRGQEIGSYKPLTTLEPVRATVVKPEPKPEPVQEPKPEPVQEQDTEITKSILNTHDGFALHVAGCGSGKTYSIARAAVNRALRGFPTLVVVPTVAAAKNVEAEIRASNQGLADEANLIARLYGQDRDNTVDPESVNDKVELESEPDSLGHYPVTDQTLIAISTHAQLIRRGFSKFVRGIYQAIEPRTIETLNGDQVERPAFSIMVDELHSFLDACRFELRLGHRYKKQASHDGRGGSMIPLLSCPKTTQSGGCGNCSRGKLGGEREFNRFSIPELEPVRPVKFNEAGDLLSMPKEPVNLTIEDFTIGEWKRVGTTLYAASVKAFRDKPVDLVTRSNAVTFTYRTEAGAAPVESVDEIVEHILSFAFRPSITKERIVNQDGDIIEPAHIKSLIAAKRLNSDEFVWPFEPCEVETLRAVDLVALDRLRRFMESNSVDIQGFTATATEELKDVLSEVFGNEFKVVEYEPPDRKIERLAIVSLKNYMTVRSLAQNAETRKLITESLEIDDDKPSVAIFSATKRQAVNLFRAVEGFHDGVHLVLNQTAISTEFSATRIANSFRDSRRQKTLIHYARGPLATGANLIGLRTLVVDCMAFRRLSSFSPDEIDRDSFMRYQAKERAAIVTQNVGRLLRGEAGKVAALILLNAEPELVEALASDEFIRGSVKSTPIVTPRYEGLESLVRDCKLWLDKKGLDPWECSESTYKSRKAALTHVSNLKRAESRQESREAKRNAKRERLRLEATEAAENDIGWKSFSVRTNIKRYFEPDELVKIRDLFRFG